MSISAQWYAGLDGSEGRKRAGRAAGATVFQKSGTLIALAPAAAARASPRSASGPAKTSGSTIAVSSGRGAEAPDGAARPSAARPPIQSAAPLTQALLPATPPSGTPTWRRLPRHGRRSRIEDRPSRGSWLL